VQQRIVRVIDVLPIELEALSEAQRTACDWLDGNLPRATVRLLGISWQQQRLTTGKVVVKVEEEAQLRDSVASDP